MTTKSSTRADSSRAGRGAARRKPGHRERLLAAAMDCLRERGYARTTARDLVAASGTNLASIGYHFGSKEALLNEAIAEGCRAWAAEVERAVVGPGRAGALEQLERSLEATVGRFEELRPFLVAFAEAFPQALRSPELRESLAAAYQDVRRATLEMVRGSLAADGIELDDADGEVIASLLVAACDGLMLQWLIDPERVPSPHDIARAFRELGEEVAAVRSSR